MFLLPPFLGWAFKTLNTAPLTRLDFVAVDLSFRVSSLIFWALTIPSLEHLRIHSCQFDFDALAEFLSRHTTITALDITFLNVHNLPTTTLPALVLLKCEPKNICRLLSPLGAFPKLADVHVVVFLSPLSQSMFNAVETSLAQAATRLMDMNIRLCLDLFPGFPVSRADIFANIMMPSLPTDLRNYPILSRVREITFGLPHPDFVATTSIPDWLSVFPVLEHLNFVNTLMEPGHEHGVSLLRRIAQKCAGVRTVNIGDDTRDVAVWLSTGS